MKVLLDKKQAVELPKNWKSTSIAGKITAVVVWGVMPIAFAITIPLLSSLEMEINKDHLWKLEQIHKSIDQQFELQQNIQSASHRELLRNKMFALKKKYKFDYLKLESASKTIVVGQCLPKSSIYNHSALHTISHKPSQDSVNFLLSICFPSIERAIELEHMKFGSLIVIFTIILGLYLVYVIRNTLHDPFQKVIDATQSVTEGNLDTRLDIQSNDEFGYLSRFFNHMVEELAVQQQRLTDSNKYLESVVENKEMALEESRAKSLFLANMSHEIRTPMTAIHGYAENLYRFGIEDKEEQQEALETIYRNSNHLINIINDILDLSKIEADKLEVESLAFSPVKLMTEVEQLMAIQAKEKGVRLRFDYDLPLPEKIHNDPTRLKQVLFNLISNALKFTREGEVTVTLSCDCQQEKLHVSVIDNGIGLSKEQINHLFQPYMQAKKSTSRQYGGTGLGLMIARRLVNLMGGDIEVTSTVGEGASFTFAISTGDIGDSPQLTEIKANDLSTADVGDNIPALSGKILLVKDIADNQKLISMYLRHAGLEIDIADNGKDGFNKALSHRYQLILMDIQMPIMDGITATQYLREAKYSAPIIALTANVLKNERETYLEAGFDDILTKPIILDEFYATIKKWLSADLETNKMITTEPSNDTFQSLVAHFLQSLAQELEEMDDFIQQQDWLSCKKMLHNIKGRGGSFGYPELTRLAGELELLLKDNQNDEFQKQYSAFKTYSQRIISK